MDTWLRKSSNSVFNLILFLVRCACLGSTPLFHSNFLTFKVLFCRSLLFYVLLEKGKIYIKEEKASYFLYFCHCLLCPIPVSSPYPH